jgi:hypothetical protein
MKRVRATAPAGADVNLLLATLRAEERDRLAARMDDVQLSRGQILCKGDDLPRYTYFPTSGLTSILAVTRIGDVVGIAAVGNEGAIGWPWAILGPGLINHVVVEVSDLARCVPRSKGQAPYRTCC